MPVLLSEVLQYLDPKPKESYLDLTAGYGGHAREVQARTKAPVVLVDRDENAVAYLRTQFKGPRAKILHEDFLTASKQLHSKKAGFDMILADLGVSSPHLNMASRGFAWSLDGPLDMRMDQRQTLTADLVVNSYAVEELAKILRDYGEEPKYRRIANAIVDARPIKTTSELAQVVARQWRGHSKVHPATRTFQALRIAVNDELGQLEQAIGLWIELLNPGGRLAVISFHSLEDRCVKQTFKSLSGNRYDAQLDLLTKHPVTASKDESVINPRSRSAKLRVVQRK